jgi:hypothetical protein
MEVKAKLRLKVNRPDEPQVVGFDDAYNSEGFTTPARRVVRRLALWGIPKVWYFNLLCQYFGPMTVPQACLQILHQLSTLVHQIRENDYAKPSDALSGSSVGQHLRHTLEFFFCFQNGFECGVVNYDKRAHDKLIETDKFIAAGAIQRISEFVTILREDRKLLLEVGYDITTDTFETIETNTMRELVYNIEHAVHHMAIIKIGVREVAPYIQLTPDFGIAASTIRYTETVAKSSQH